jgi:outer membrane protein assembly factor BamB
LTAAAARRDGWTRERESFTLTDVTLRSLLCLAGLCLTCLPVRAQTQAPANSGFPQSAATNASLANVGLVTYNKPLVVDLDNNGGTLEIVVGTDLGNLFVFNSNGTVRAGWPQTPCPAGGGQPRASELVSSPAAGQLDADTPLEIVIGCGSVPDDRDRGQVTAFNIDGSVLWSFAGMFDVVNGDGQPDAVWSTPALGDLNDDGKDDVVFGSFDERVYALNGTNGTLLPGWPVWVRETVFSSPALADLDGNGTLEIVIGADVHPEPPPINVSAGKAGALWVFRRNGSQFPGFPKFVNFGIGSSPAVGHISGDGCPEIVVGTAFPPPPYSDTTGRELHAWSRDGSPLPGWPKALLGHPQSSPALVNLDADADLEVVATATTLQGGNPFGEGRVYAIDGNGATLPGFPLRPVTDAGGVPAALLQEPIAVRFGAAATDPSIFVGGPGFEVTHVSKTGTQLSDSTPPITPGAVYYPVNGNDWSPAAGDLDDNGTLVLVAAAGRVGNDLDDIGVYAWNLGADTGTQPWPMFRQGPKRQGAAPGTGSISCPLPRPALDFYTLTPCRVADSRQGGFLTYGGPVLVAGEQRTITIPDVPSCPNPPTNSCIPPWRSLCGVPSTAKAVALNVTVDQPNMAGSLTLFPGGDGLPNTSTINFAAGRTRANNTVMPLSFDGRGNLTIFVNMAAGGQVHVILDVVGYFQ